MDGNSIDIINSNKYLKNHFKFIAYYCQSLVSYNCKPRHKKYIVKMIRHFPENPLVMTIGNSISDQ